MNLRFTAETGSPLAVSLERNLGHSVLASFPIAGDDNGDGRVRLDLDHAVALDENRSRVAGVAGFPGNVEIVGHARRPRGQRGERRGRVLRGSGWQPTIVDQHLWR